jgi:hypothetical protein
MRISAKGGEDTGNIGTLQGVCNLHPEETETQVPQFPK